MQRKGSGTKRFLACLIELFHYHLRKKRITASFNNLPYQKSVYTPCVHSQAVKYRLVEVMPVFHVETHSILWRHPEIVAVQLEGNIILPGVYGYYAHYPRRYFGILVTAKSAIRFLLRIPASINCHKQSDNHDQKRLHQDCRLSYRIFIRPGKKKANSKTMMKK